jgi:ADP-L-glycero-D-manno-heptose 6-epimerase
MKFILVTGAYGFIGSNFVKYLNNLGIENILVSDYLDNGRQYKNLLGAKFVNYVHPDFVVNLIQSGTIEKVFHFGAVSDTTCWDGNLVMTRNVTYTLNLLNACIMNNVFVSYSSSASVYGNNDGPLNLYAYSKYLVDKAVMDNNYPVQGFRYFNVYATNDSEWHKDKQASPFYQFKQQALNNGVIKVFEGSESIFRDFVHVDRVCEVQWNMSNRDIYGIFDLGTGTTRSFQSVADEVAIAYDAKVHTIAFPEHLKGCYQYNTLADMTYYA